MIQIFSNQRLNTTILLSVLFVINCSTIPTEQLFEEYYEKPILSEQMLNDTTILLQEANAAYQNDDFKNAIQQYEVYAGQNPEAFEVELYLGVCYLSDNQIDLAMITFENIKEHGTQKVQAAWLLALSYLKNKDINHCKKTLITLLQEETLNATAKEKINRLVQKL